MQEGTNNIFGSGASMTQDREQDSLATSGYFTRLNSIVSREGGDREDIAGGEDGKSEDSGGELDSSISSYMSGSSSDQEEEKK